jgi:hypothetical protein
VGRIGIAAKSPPGGASVSYPITPWSDVNVT